MVTEDEFQDALASHDAWARKVAWQVFASSVVLAVGPLVAVIVLLLIYREDDDMYGYAIIVPFMGLLAVCLLPVFQWWHERWFRRDSRLVCPQCDRAMQLDRRWVIVTRTCPHCNLRVLGDTGYGKKKPWPDPEL